MPVAIIFVCTQDLEEREADKLMAQATMGIFVTGEETKQITIVIDGAKVLSEVPSVANAIALFFWTHICLESSISKGFTVHPRIFPKGFDGAGWRKDIRQDPQPRYKELWRVSLMASNLV